MIILLDPQENASAREGIILAGGRSFNKAAQEFSQGRELTY